MQAYYSIIALVGLSCAVLFTACHSATLPETAPSSPIIPTTTNMSTEWQTACLASEILEAETLDYDIEVTVSAPRLSREYYIRVSGDDYHLTGHLTIGEGYDAPPFSGKVEVMEVAGTIYSREGEGGWDVLDEAPAGVVDNDYTFVTLCPREHGSLSEDVEVIGSIPTRRFNMYRNVLADPPNPRSALNLAVTYWVDDSGRLVQRHSIHRYPKLDDPTHPLYGYDGGTREETWLVSGVGEPNVITAPEIP